MEDSNVYILPKYCIEYNVSVNYMLKIKGGVCKFQKFPGWEEACPHTL